MQGEAHRVGPTKWRFAQNSHEIEFVVIQLDDV
jgi:hypothetical protein